MESLPSLRGVFGDLMAELNSTEPSIDRIGRIISDDICMSARILQLVNSSFSALVRVSSAPRPRSSCLA